MSSNIITSIFFHLKSMYLNVMFLNLFIQMLIVRRRFPDISGSSYIKGVMEKGNTCVEYPCGHIPWAGIKVLHHECGREV